MERREVLKLSAAALLTGMSGAASQAHAAPEATEPSSAVEQWGVFELSLHAATTGNPFQDTSLTATFTNGHRSVQVNGFYDGDDTYRVRFMPDTPGHWSYQTQSNVAALTARSGAFTCTAPTAANHGPVTTARRFHFEYADGTPYYPFGTTTYAYLFTSEANAANALEGLRAYFNKTRCCVLPKPLGKGSMPLPFPNTGAKVDGTGGTNDYTRFNPEYFRTLEQRILALQAAGIEADCILFHPYDAWGYKAMPNEVCDFYLRYVIARLAAYRNVWWSLANEYDLVKAKTTADWDHFFRTVQSEDPYAHLRSIHHSQVIYDNSKPWCTHASLQSYDFEKSAERRLAWNKPIIYDEIQYEGDVERRWGNLTAEEMTRRFWLAVIHGSYASHGEVFVAAEDGPHAHESSWSDAGRLRGESAARIRYLRQLLEGLTPVGLTEFEGSYYLSAGKQNELYLWYFDYHRPARYSFPLPATATFSAALIDPFAMTETKLPGTFTGKSAIPLPSRPYQAIVFRKLQDAPAAAINTTPKNDTTSPEP